MTYEINAHSTTSRDAGPWFGDVNIQIEDCSCQDGYTCLRLANYKLLRSTKDEALEDAKQTLLKFNELLPEDEKLDLSKL
jgi:hypothetical protein